ncbi:unnamed protein product, partial [Iphiclides podalirius]
MASALWPAGSRVNGDIDFPAQAPPVIISDRGDLLAARRPRNGRPINDFARSAAARGDTIKLLAAGEARRKTYDYIRVERHGGEVTELQIAAIAGRTQIAWPTRAQGWLGADGNVFKRQGYGQLFKLIQST